MIDAKELRIGNLVYLELGFPSLDIHTIRPEDIASIAKDSKNVLPIPLTTEILLKCGFDTDKITFWIYYSIKGTVSYLSLTCDYLWLYDNQLSNIDKYPRREIRYLHQLQNLFYALTQKELDIKL